MFRRKRNALGIQQKHNKKTSMHCKEETAQVPLHGTTVYLQQLEEDIFISKPSLMELRRYCIKRIYSTFDTYAQYCSHLKLWFQNNNLVYTKPQG